MIEERCKLCNGKMVLKEERVVVDTKYNIFKCEKCNRIVAKVKE